MFEGMKALAERSAMERVVLLVNHVIAAEPAAVERLRPHATRTMLFELTGWPNVLPPFGPFAFRVTAAGLIEWIEAPTALPPDLRAAIDVPNPALALARMVGGVRPPVAVTGDAAFASDLHWLIENVRWDVQDDLARIVGDAPAREIAKVGAMLANGLRDAVRALRDLAGRGAKPATEPPAGSSGP